MHQKIRSSWIQVFYFYKQNRLYRALVVYNYVRSNIIWTELYAFFACSFVQTPPQDMGRHLIISRWRETIIAL
jgi:hypothetical protein